MNLARGRAFALGIAATLVACKPTTPVAEQAGGDAAAAGGPVDAAQPARCTLGQGGADLGETGDRRALVVGDAIPTNDGFAVGLLRAAKSGAEAVVARVSGHRVAEEWIVAKRGEIVADAPPPRPLLGPGVLYAAYVASSAPDAGARSRRILLAKAGTATPLASFPDQATESLAFDAAMACDVSHVALAWDDDSAHGGIQFAIVPIVPLTASTPIGPRVVSDGVTDVDGPRVAPRAGGGWWVSWSARREEPIEGGARPEAPGEGRGVAWVELVAVDAAGATVGPIHKITSPTGHVASFDLAPRASGHELDVFARDETQSREGEGGRILHVVVHDAAIDDAVVVVPEGVGRGAVDVIAGSGGDAWLSYTDGADRPHLMPLGESRVPAGSATAEEALDGARLLALTAASPARFVAAFPSEEGSLFRDVACTR